MYVEYNYDQMKQEVTREYFQNNHDYSMLRYQPMMSIAKHNVEPLHVGWTPLYHSPRLAEALSIKALHIKDEGLNPTLSLKDRPSLVACLKAIEAGADTLCCSSTGNAASSMAGNAAKLGLNSIIFVPDRVPVGKLTQLIMYGAKVVSVNDDYKETYNISKEIIDRYHFYNRNAAINPHLVEGKKTVALEIAEQLDFNVPDVVFVSVGDGCTIAGVYKGFYDLLQLGLTAKIPRLIGVQSEGCSPFYNAFKHGGEVEVDGENTIADSIAVSRPRNPVKGMKAVVDSGGEYITVTDEEILEAIVVLGKKEGIFAEPAGATGFAGLIKMQRNWQLANDTSVAVIVTGNGLKDQHSVRKELDKMVKLDKTKFHKYCKHMNVINLDDLITKMKDCEVQDNE